MKEIRETGAVAQKSQPSQNVRITRRLAWLSIEVRPFTHYVLKGISRNKLASRLQTRESREEKITLRRLRRLKPHRC